MHLFFDLDNTLWDFDVNSYQSLKQLHGELELENKLGTSFDNFHQYYVKKNDELWHLYYFGKIEKAELRYRRFYETFMNFGVDDLALSKIISEEYVRISPYSRTLKPGCIETLEALHGKFKLHIITNGFTEVQNIKLDNCGLRRYFDQIIISEEYKLTKPHADIFRLAEKMSGAETEQCTMIGDNWVSDIEGALGAGWKAVYMSDADVPDTSRPVKRICALPELIPLVK